MSRFDVRELCQREHLNIEELAQVFAVHETTVWRWLRKGDRNRMEFFMRLAALTGKAPVELWPCLGEVQPRHDPGV